MPELVPDGWLPELWLAHLTLALFALVILPGAGLRPALQAVWLLALLGISFIAVDGLSLAAYVRSFSGDVAITSLVGLLFAAAVRLGLVARLEARARWQVLMVMAGLALVLYPATMGLSDVDPYRLGYNPRPLIVVIGLLALGLLVLRNGLGVAMLALATLAFSLGLKPSPNYWDYLLDPFIALYSWVALSGCAARCGWRRWQARRALTPLQRV